MLFRDDADHVGGMRFPGLRTTKAIGLVFTTCGGPRRGRLRFLARS
jgi:hypothetical protein